MVLPVDTMALNRVEEVCLRKLELFAGALFFALAGAATLLLRQPLDVIGWIVVVSCVAFVALAIVGMVRPAASASEMISRTTFRQRAGFEIDGDGGQTPTRNPTTLPARGIVSGTPHRSLVKHEDKAPAREPTTSELEVLTATIAALEAVGGLKSGEVDALALWTAIEELDPGQPIGIDEALGSFAALYDLGRSHIGRMTFVPAHTEYDGALLAEITASVLTSLGHDFRTKDIVVTLPPDGKQGRASIVFSLAGRSETVECSYLWKYPPADLLPNLKRFSTTDDPRQLVGVHSGDQTLLYVSIREGCISQLNGLLPADTDLFYEV